MERRHFLGAGAALAALAAPRWLLGQTCAPTLPDRYGEGPFYLPGAPERTRIAGTAEPGERLTISGTATNCRGPLAGLRMEVWHATRSGCYIHPNQSCDQVPGTDSQARLWGRITTDAQGRYAFDTIKPGRYLNGSRFRPSHIHFRITAPGQRVFPGPNGPVDFLITQLYFQGDEYIPGDYAADHPSAATRIIPLARQGTGPWNGTWNINLPDIPTGLGRNVLEDPALAAFDVAARRVGWRVLFQLPPLPAGEKVEMRLLASDGSLVRRSLHGTVPIELDATFLPKGAYHMEFRWWTRHGLRTEKTSLVL